MHIETQSSWLRLLFHSFKHWLHQQEGCSATVNNELVNALAHSSTVPEGKQMGGSGESLQCLGIIMEEFTLDSSRQAVWGQESHLKQETQNQILSDTETNFNKGTGH